MTLLFQSTEVSRCGGVTLREVAYCGATLINNQYILTAGHCIPDMQTSGLGNFRVWIGTNFITDLASDFDDYLDLEISEIKSHPKFDFETAEYDVALIKVSEPIKFSKRVRPICLTQPEENTLVGKIGVITGWGSLTLTTPTEEELKESDVVIVTNEECKKNYTTVDIPVLDTMLCGSVMTLDGQDPCKGDSGGPLMLKVKNRITQIGIISHGQGCSSPAFPTIFSRMSKFIEWIQQNTQDALYCRGSF
ncbi:Serine proteinase stubble [Folsomia candida]|uniref:Serine proteinase stubble n=1 Tax=Folsomia candida TaxID=158441 RepID=A0A226DA51_FOLCA|nr:Serine proteinase stubble [Folsomia candida]